MENLRVGTSGWIYAHWKGDYYPADLPQKDWYGHYVRDFDTVEINNTFYHLPKPETFEHWGEVAPEDFLYTFKASRYITHIKRLLEPEKTLEKFLTRIRAAGRSLGPVLFQLPPRFPADPARLEAFLQALPADLVRVFEFRDDSWHQEPVREPARALRRRLLHSRPFPCQVPPTGSPPTPFTCAFMAPPRRRTRGAIPTPSSKKRRRGSNYGGGKGGRFTPTSTTTSAAMRCAMR